MRGRLLGIVFLPLLLARCASTLDRFIADAERVGPLRPAEGTSHQRWLPRFIRAAEQQGFEVRIQPLPAEEGRIRWGTTSVSDEGQRIVAINALLPVNGQVEALAHELDHVYDRQRREPAAYEVFAEAVAMLLTTEIGLRQSRGTSLHYLIEIDGGAAYLRQIAREVEQAAQQILRVARPGS